MENSLLMILTALLLLGVQGISAQISFNTSTPSTPRPTIPTTTTTLQATCPKLTEYIIKSEVFQLKVMRKASPCEGQLYVNFRERQVYLCSSSDISLSWWSGVCKDRRCGDFKGFKHISTQAKGLLLTSNKTFVDTKCNGLYIMCEDPLGTELAAYKAVTGILIFLILGVILVQFGRPTYKAIRKRFSQKRQSRWVGPTQSVCYNRGQGPPNKNTDKRQSFPGLERLTVNQSREPSSNRNSDYDSYGYS
ncbi:T-cell surface glycoprotein CD5 [Carassius auratus]|uniref:T-cell surface glycoprotein CD5 n=1 Tax=Carassius auratus TaxID=7957 RepID=A0A6P6PDG7_CARAU|nr:T-cell surface glycoprotein CD5-like [Carassius auratus]XP_052400748.1 T-cell surface glycoprotein CD5 [Carassius gibelio]